MDKNDLSNKITKHIEGMPVTQYIPWDKLDMNNVPAPTPETEFQCPCCGGVDLLTEYESIWTEGGCEGFECPAPTCRRLIHYGDVPTAWAEYIIERDYHLYDEDYRADQSWFVDKLVD
jgi:hypothetical protein